jgi:hypothetical protein
MLNFFVIYVVVALFSLAGILYLVLNAPAGSEDEKGFHYTKTQPQIKFASKSWKKQFAYIKQNSLQHVK